MCMFVSLITAKRLTLLYEPMIELLQYLYIDPQDVYSGRE